MSGVEKKALVLSTALQSEYLSAKTSYFPNSVPQLPPLRDKYSKLQKFKYVH